jgi:hypothetical protein
MPNGAFSVTSNVRLVGMARRVPHQSNIFWPHCI